MTFSRESTGVSITTALQSVQLSRVRKEDPDTLLLAISRLLNFANNQINLPAEKKLNMHQIIFIASELMAQYWFLKFDELVLVLRKGITGKFGPVYNQFDATVIFEWFEKYIRGERDSYIETEAHRKAHHYKMLETKQLDSSEVNHEGLEKLAGIFRTVVDGTETPAAKPDSEEEYRKYRQDYIRNKPPQTSPDAP